MSRVLIARNDDLGDVVLLGPAVRAVARQAEVVLLTSPRGAPAAHLLPGVAEVVEVELPWIAARPERVRRGWVAATTALLAALRVDEAMICTSFHQSPLPLALLLREAGVARIGAISEDYPGSLLDVRHRVDDGLHEVERSRSLARAMGYRAAPDDDGRLALRPDAVPVTTTTVDRSGVVVHPGCSVPARTWTASGFAGVVRRLADAGVGVVVTGGPGEEGLVQRVAGPTRPEVERRCGDPDLRSLAGVLAGATVVVAGNTGPAHLAAAVGTPVVSIFPPTVPAYRWRPWGVPHRLLGDQHIDCAGCRARSCPRAAAERGDEPVQPCLAAVSVDRVVEAVEQLSWTVATVP